MFSCEFLKNFKNTYFEELLQLAVNLPNNPKIKIFQLYGGQGYLWCVDKVKVLSSCLGSWVKCIFLLSLVFAVLIFTEEEIKDLETVVYMLFCGALERSNNPYIESILESFAPKNLKEILTMWVRSSRKSWRKDNARVNKEA